MGDMNRLELALCDDVQLEFYLEDVTTAGIRKDIEEIQNKASKKTIDVGMLREKIQKVLDESA